jgi:DNA polymerase III subunit epsilon
MKLPFRARGPAPGGPLLAGRRANRGRTPWRLAHFVVVDLELSGLDPRHDEIISFAAVPVDAGRIVAGNAVYGLSRNTRDLPEESVLVHGIRTVDLADAPPLDEAIAPLLTVLTGRVLVAHAAWIERSFLDPVLRRHGERLRGPILDTRDLGRLLALERGMPAGESSLSGLARSLGLPVHRPHHALGDALTTAQVFIALVTLLDGHTPQTVRSLSLARRRAQALSVYSAGPAARRPDGHTSSPDRE